jgi:hypothetical protein
MSDDHTTLPTIADTSAALQGIKESCRAAAAVALKTLAERLIETVCQVDRELGVAQCVRSIKVTIINHGNFRLDIDEYNTGIDAAALSREIEEGVNRGDTYDKILRSVQIEQGALREPTYPPVPRHVADPLAAQGSAGVPAAAVGEGPPQSG